MFIRLDDWLHRTKSTSKNTGQNIDIYFGRIMMMQFPVTCLHQCCQLQRSHYFFVFVSVNCDMCTVKRGQDLVEAFWVFLYCKRISTLVEYQKNCKLTNCFFFSSILSFVNNVHGAMFIPDKSRFTIGQRIRGEGKRSIY